MIRTDILLEVERYVEIAKANYPNANIKMPTVEMSNRLTVCAGKAKKRGNDYKVVFSNSIIEDNGLQNVMDRTVPHEVAHIVEWYVFGNAGHGSNFKHIMRHVFGLSAEVSTRCHNFEVRQRPSIKYPHVCPKCNAIINVGKKVATNIANGARYTHGSCGCRVHALQRP